MSLTLLRVIQEACSNSIKHGHAKEINVSLKYEPKSLTLTIKDDGDGFDTSAIPEFTRDDNSGFGLSMMKERIYLLSGKISISSRPGEEWAKVAKKLAKNNTVYTIDLLGCGRSDKPSIQYTSYMYVQIITAFVNDVIGKPVNVAATNLSTAPVIMANALSKDLFNKIILINPVSLQQLSCIPDKSTKFKQNIINLPIIGTFIYNKLMSPIKVDLLFRNKFISRSQLISDKMKDAYYESAHKGQSRGKYLYSSILSNYINTNIAPALKNLDKDVSIIASTGIKNNMDVINNYHKLNSKCDIIHIANAKLYPQLELPEKTASIIKKIVTN